MRTLLYLSTLSLSLFLMTSCAKKDNGGTYTNLTVINHSGAELAGQAVYVFKESNDVILNKKPADALRVKYTDGLGEVQFNLESPDLFGTDQKAVFSFRVMEERNGDFVTIASFDKEIAVGDIVNHILTVK